MTQPNLVPIPSIALSVRQPWAWAIVFAGKNIENRTWQAVERGAFRRRRIAIHAAKGLTQYEYAEAVRFMDGIGVKCPKPSELERGGIIGAVDVLDIVKYHASPWFTGPRGLLLANPVSCAFVPAVGALGFFKWEPACPSIVPEPSRWMQPVAAGVTGAASVQSDLFVRQ